MSPEKRLNEKPGLTEWYFRQILWPKPSEKRVLLGPLCLPDSIFMAYHLPVDYPRPIPLSKRELELDRAIEYLVAARMENYGDTEGNALRRIVLNGPGNSIFGILIDGRIQKTISRHPSGLRDRAANVWGSDYPAVMEANRLRISLKRDRLESLGFLLDCLISWVRCRPGSHRFERMGYRHGRTCHYFGRTLRRLWNQ